MKEMIKDPISWAIGGVASFFGVLGVMLTDPTMSIMVIIEVLFQNASALFTASSIAGFTLAPEVSMELARVVQGIAFISGVVIVAKMVGRLWDNVKEKVKG